MIEYNKIINDIIFTQTDKINSLSLLIVIIFALLVSIAFDVIIGELPGRIHPVVIIGSIIDSLKSVCIGIKNKTSGLLLVIGTTAMTCLILFVIYFICSYNSILLFLVFIIFLSSTFSIKMLLNTAIGVKNDLNESLDKARQSVSYLVSRSTDELTESFIVSATIESLTENITDSYIAPIFYYFIFSIIILLNPFYYQLYFLLLVPMLYRMFNTLDAMVGYKSDELINIGFVPAKIDDILNYIPSRISGIYVVVSAYLLRYNGKSSFEIMMRDARNCPSPNSGYTMASAAGALDIKLVKKQTYILGDENKPIEINDIEKAVRLSKLTIALFTLTIILLLILIKVIL
ncbi:cobalamin biosynthesis protein [Methanobrevibacter sp.]|uniref:cobalamin biosynthesis protein n=1 Tax=Methanobrevibacter sp. TaxID=66852 RepID=UPI0026E09EBF|nr:cobalamin biosynthesis protein [Methanobrevibacter sp.]MDO5861082.1 cobalamin biosynthesis protein [Methanobrevibacter sp.]